MDITPCVEGSIDLAELLALDLVQLLENSLLLRFDFLEYGSLLVSPLLLALSEGHAHVAGPGADATVGALPYVQGGALAAVQLAVGVRGGCARNLAACVLTGAKGLDVWAYSGAKLRVLFLSVS